VRGSATRNVENVGPNTSLMYDGFEEDGSDEDDDHGLWCITFFGEPAS